jgi:hypothetical protein
MDFHNAFALRRVALPDARRHAKKRKTPAPLTLTEICCEIEMRWELTFLTDLDRSSWRRDCVGRALRSLVVQKKIAARHTMKGGDPTSEVARWTAIEGCAP